MVTRTELVLNIYNINIIKFRASKSIIILFVTKRNSRDDK